MNPGQIKRVTWAAGLSGAALAGRAMLADWCDRRGIEPKLRSPLLPLVSVPYTASTLPLWRNMFRLSRWSGPRVSVRTRRFGDHNVGVRVTTPAGGAQRKPLVVWLHSGGMIVGSPQFEGPMAGMLARRLDAVVAAPDYRLAPEHPFPAALDDCIDTVKWAISHADQLGIDPTRIALAGASAGGGLTATSAQRCQDEGIEVRALAMLYPMLDNHNLHQELGAAVAWSSSSNQFGWDSYLGDDAGGYPTYSVASRRENLAATPPTFIAVGDIDILHDQAVDFASRLQDSGVHCELIVVPGMFHAADILVPWASTIRNLHAALTVHLARYLSAEPEPPRHRDHGPALSS